MHQGKYIFYAQLISLIVLSGLCAQQLAFPTAEGFGRFTAGGRGGAVIEVTNLNDNGPGSLRAAVAASGARTVVFRVSGNIILNSRLSIKNDNITIAGQTAPGDGICIRDYDFIVDADNVIIRYLRFRLGDVKAVEADAFGGTSNNSVIIDHCTVSWSVDEASSFYDNKNFTMQWCLISESMKYSVHSKGPHGYGGIWGGMGASFHHNLLAHHDSRNPRFQGSRNESTPETEIVDHRNNVIYNWDGNSAYGGESGNHNMVANYYKYGPATDSKRNRIVEPSDNLGSWYVADNYVFGYPLITANNWAGGVQNADLQAIRAYEPIPFAPVNTHEAEKAYELVLADAGASLVRDTVDSRIVMEVRTGTATYGGLTGAGTGIIDSQNDVGGWPELHTYGEIVDNDRDGMADDWETQHGLNSDDPEDRNGDIYGDGYTNLEYYLNQLIEREDFLLAPAELKAFTISDTGIYLFWKENAPNESGFRIERSLSPAAGFELIGSTGKDIREYSDTQLQAETRYYYRIRAFNDHLSSLYTNTADAVTLDSTGLPLPVSDPSPAHLAVNILLPVKLKWLSAPGAESYEVYLGTSESPELVATQAETVFDPGSLKENTTYYWRVDAVNQKGKTAGLLWQFTTISLDPILVAYWPMDKGYGSFAPDKSGNLNNAVLLNMSDANWVTGIKGSPGLFFNGMNQFLGVNHKDMLDFNTKSFTLICWIRPTDRDRFMPILGKISDSPETGRRGYLLSYQPGSILRFEVADSTRSSVLDINTSSLVAGDWEYIAVVRDAGNHQLLLYYNGELAGTAPDSTRNIDSGAGLFMASDFRNQNFYSGILDDFRLYENIVPEETIVNLYQEAVAVIGPDETAAVPVEYSLTNHPNPFNNATLISYTLPKAGMVQIYIYNLLGEIVARPVDAYKPAGRYSINFDSTGLASGIYLCRFDTPDFAKTNKMILVK